MLEIDRIQRIPFATQDYVSVQYGDGRIDMYVTEPAGGVRESTGLLLLLHGWGNDGCEAYAADSVAFADGFDLVVTRVEYRQCGREASAPLPGETYDMPYDFSRLQTIDCVRAAYATLARYPQIDRTRLLLWGGSQGGHLGAQCLVFAPHLWALAVLTCGLYLPMTHAQSMAAGFHDLSARPGCGFVECALGAGETFAPAEEDIRNPLRNAGLMPAATPVILIHGTHDETVDIRHSVWLYARLLGLGRPVRFYAVEGGDHGLVWATFEDENSRLKATLKYAADALREARRPDAYAVPGAPVRIAVRGGTYRVDYPPDGPVLRWMADGAETASSPDGELPRG